MKGLTPEHRLEIIGKMCSAHFDHFMINTIDLQRSNKFHATGHQTAVRIEENIAAIAASVNVINVKNASEATVHKDLKFGAD